MLFSNSIVLTDKTRHRVNKVGEVKGDLEAKGLTLIRSKTEYLGWKFSSIDDRIVGIVIEDTIVPRVEEFRYLALIVWGDGDIDKHIVHHIRVGWQNWR